jgi:hypothetical protein
MLSAHKRSTPRRSGKFSDRGELLESEYQALAFRLLVNIDRGVSCSALTAIPRPPGPEQ